MDNNENEEIALFWGDWGPVWYMCLKTENFYLKTFMKIRMGEKVYKNEWNIV